MLRIGVLVFVAAALAAPNTATAVGDEALLKCSAIEDSAKRLVCFDLLAAGAQSAADREAESAVGADEVDPVSAGAWQVSVESSKIDDTTSVFIHVPASEADTLDSLRREHHSLRHPVRERVHVRHPGLR